MLSSVVMVALTDTLAVMRNVRNTSVKEKNTSGRRSLRNAKKAREIDYYDRFKYWR